MKKMSIEREVAREGSQTDSESCVGTVCRLFPRRERAAAGRLLGPGAAGALPASSQPAAAAPGHTPAVHAQLVAKRTPTRCFQCLC